MSGRFKFKEQPNAGQPQVALVKGQLGQFKLMCPVEWELGVSAQNEIEEKASRVRGGKHLIFINKAEAKNKESVRFYGNPSSALPFSHFSATISKQFEKNLNIIKKGLSRGHAINLEIIGLGYTIEGLRGDAIEKIIKGKEEKLYEQSPFAFVVNELKKKKFQFKDQHIPEGHFLPGATLQSPLYKRPNATNAAPMYIILNLGKSHKIYHYVDQKCVDVVPTKSKDNTTTLLIFGISLSIIKQIAMEIGRYKRPNAHSPKGISTNIR